MVAAVGPMKAIPAASEIGRDRSLARAHLIGLVGLEAVEAELVLLGENRHGALAKLVSSAQHANGDLAPVGNEDFLKLGHVAVLLCSVGRGSFHAAE
jgi:hypothetical protein